MMTKSTLYLVGIGGVFMAGLARLAKESEIEVAGCDGTIWPPMSTQLSEMGIEPDIGWETGFLKPHCSPIIIGNALSRGNPVVESILDQGLAYTSAAQWLYENILCGRDVIAIAGTHGKTTTSSMLAWILHQALLNPGFLIGSVVKNFGVSSCLGDKSAPFVLEADEYDTAFFDKRPKFLHYRPQTLILNNLEFDHADIYADIDAIKCQFAYLLRSVPSNGKVIYNQTDPALQDVLDAGVWAECETFSLGISDEISDWSAIPCTDGFELFHRGKKQGICQWQLVGKHNISNAVAAIAAACHHGVSMQTALDAMQSFQGVSRRLEIKAEVNGITIYDDFAHHPTAIRASLQAVKEKGEAKVIAVFEPRSNTMKMGKHSDILVSSFKDADKVILYQPPDLDWSLQSLFDAAHTEAESFSNTEELLNYVCKVAGTADKVVFMSNGAFDNLPERTVQRLMQNTTP